MCIYNKETKKWLNVQKTINPDIVFFTKPYRDTLYFIYKFSDKITCFANYGYAGSNDYILSFGLPLHNLVTHYFLENEEYKKYAEKYSTIKGKNTIVTGYPGIETLIDGHIPIDVWKKQNNPKKRIIIAPHHTLNDTLNVSNFLLYCDFFVELAKKYENKIQFAFKPHPILKFKLINLWGQKKTENYYNLWNEMPNTQLETGYYTDLFLTSDSMIFDSVSFINEYFFTLKPALFLFKNDKIFSQFNPFSINVLNNYYHAHNMENIESFIQNVVLDGNDPMSEQRKEFFNEYLYPKDGIMPSEKILNVLLKDIE